MVFVRTRLSKQAAMKRLIFCLMLGHLIVESSLLFTKTEQEAIREIIHEEFLKKDIAGKGLETSSNATQESENRQVHASAGENKPGLEERMHSSGNDSEGIDGNSLNVCMDMYDNAKCRELRDNFDMCDKDRMKDMCAETCGYCSSRTHAFVDCGQTKYGCCPDKVTAKSDPLGTACLSCVDKSPELCTGNEDDCNSIDWVGNWMKRNCRKTCGACKEAMITECEDDKDQRRFCLSWKKQGLCIEVEDLMIKHCRKTCGFCVTTSSTHISDRR